VKGLHLQRRHIVTSPDLEAIVTQAIESLPRRDGVRVKSSRRIPGSAFHAREQRIVIRDNTFLDVEEMGTGQRKGRNPRRG